MTVTDSPTKRVAIIGGGISGLSAAWELQQQAPSLGITLFESAQRLGGIIETKRIEGHTVECGPDSILKRVPHGVGLCSELGLEDELIGTNPEAAGVYSVHRGKLVRVPDGLAAMAPKSRWQMATTPLISPLGKLRMLGESRVAKRDSDAGDESLADFSRRRFGREVFERIIQPLAGGIFMGDPERLSLPACFPQFAKMEAEHGSLIRAVKANQAGRPSKPSESVFATPQNGLGQVIDRLRNRLTNVEFRLGCQVTGISRIGDFLWQLSGAGASDSPFDGVIVATPARGAATLTQMIDEELSKQLTGINSSNSAIVIVASKRSAVSHPLAGTGFVVPHVESRRAAACTFSSKKYTERAPDDEVTFRVFMGGSQHPEMIDWSDEQLRETATDELRQLVGLTGDALWCHVVRWPKSMPQYELGHLDRVASIMRETEAIPGIELAGNYLHGVGIPYCVASGRSAARRLLAKE